MYTMVENVIAARADNRPSMLEKSQYNSWQCHMKLYIRGKEHGKDLLDSVLNGPFKYGTVEVPDTPTTPASTRLRTYDDLTDKEKIREECDIRATNIVLQGLPPDVYTLVNHHTDAKEIWDRVKLLIEGIELLLQERESKMYNEFDRFTSEKGGSIHSYYLSKFVTDVKLAKDMHESNFDQLYAYLRQHEVHANEVRMMRERFPNPLSLVANSYITPPYYNNHQTQYNQSQYHQQLSPVARQFYSPSLQQQSYEAPAHHQSYRPQVAHQTPVNVQGRQTQGYAGSGARGNATGTGVNRNVGTNSANPTKNSEWFKEKMLLAQALEAGVVLDKEQMADDGAGVATDCDEAPSASAILVAKLSAYDSDVLSEVPTQDTYQTNIVIDQSVHEMQYSEQPPFMNESDIDITSDSNVNQNVNESLTAELERYKEQIKIFEERQNFDLTDREKYIDGQMRGVIVDRNTKFDSHQKEIQTLKLQLSANIESNKVLNNQMDVLKQEFSAKQEKYIKEIVDLETKKKKKALDNIVYKTGQTLQTMHMLTKPQVFYDESHKTALGYQNPLYLTQAQRKQHVLYCGHTIVKKHDALSSKHFGYIFQNSISEKPPVQPEPIPKEIRRELPSIRTRGFEHIRKAFEKDDIPFVKSLRDSFTTFDQGLFQEINDMKEVFNQMETEQIIFQDVMCTSMHVDFKHNCVLPANDNRLEYVEMEQSYVDEYSKVLELEAELSKKNDMVKKAVYNELSKRSSRLEQHCINLEITVQQMKETQLQKKNTTISNLKDHIATLKGKSVSDCIVSVNNSYVIAPGMYKLDLEPLSLKLRKNREAHVDYLKQTKEHVDTLRGIVEQARAHQPLDSALDYAYKFSTRIQELLVYVNATCPSSLNKNEKLVANTPMNKGKKVRVKSYTSASGSKPSGNTKKNRITRTSSSNQNNKVEDHLRSVKSSLNKKNRVFNCIASTKHVVFNANSKLVCSTCNECLFNACHDMCVVDYLNNVNKHAKSRSGKSNKKQDRKPTVPSKKPIPAKVVKKTPPSRNNSGKLKAPTSVSSSSKSKIVESSRTDCSLVATIMGYGDYQIGNVTISQVYYVEGLGHNSFSVGQLCDANLEVAFRKHLCFVRDLEGVDLLKGSRSTNLLSYLNFGTINELAKQGLVRGLPKLKYEKDHLCSACSLGKSKKHTHKPKSENFIQEKLYLLHMDLCGPIKIKSINGKKYILVIVDDYSWFTWVKFLRSKDETHAFIIKFLKQVQVRLNATIKNIRIDNGT
ncbi:retrovirus-related pol polyprotein from transposon TNT 1-94 [Tanacetum coccineum]